MKRIIIPIIFIFLLDGCQWVTWNGFSSDKKEEKTNIVNIPSVSLEQQFFVNLNGWDTDEHTLAFSAFMKTCDRLSKKQTDGLVKKNGIAGKYSDWQNICTESKFVDENSNIATKRFFERWFLPYLVRDKKSNDENGLFTGYYEPLLMGSMERNEKYQTPLYLRPANLIDVNLGSFRDKLSGEKISGRIENNRLVPYYDREEINDGALIENGEVLLWVDDPVQAFFLHIQGSGSVQMEDGTQIRVGYDGQNGHVYYAIGRHLVDAEIVTKEEVSLPVISNWLLENSSEAQEVMNKNKSYIFFKKLDGLDSPLGGEGIELTPRRSLAIDHRIFPYGMPVWLDINGVFADDEKIQRLMIAQDTGGAIRGAVRGDIFWGNGQDAKKYAGHMKSNGKYWVLLPRNITIPEDMAQRNKSSLFNKIKSWL